MIRSKFVSWLACAAGLAIPIAGFAQNKPKIVVVTHGQVSDPFWNVVHQGVLQAPKDADCTAEYRAPEKFDMVSLSQAIDAAVASKPDGLVVSIPDPEALSPSIQRAVDAGKKLKTKRFVGQEQLVVSRKVGQEFKKMGVKKIACLNQEVGNTALDERAKGLAEGFGGKVDVVAVPQIGRAHV